VKAEGTPSEISALDRIEPNQMPLRTLLLGIPTITQSHSHSGRCAAESTRLPRWLPHTTTMATWIGTRRRALSGGGRRSLAWKIDLR
jgi:hypothetical protein